ncbi:Fe(2+) transporter permease subunit FeoB [Beggiatoa leptomitoformis]|uniref:Ferrous iron transport protein B n=1 Tax=Beggiatoa leptomitoformis TaxID=288004 RepID=A0A2N9YA06_9GAMM|nr:Fe(2+) transporter permease subunit FeoB [Beggiatoa leptomitoformis]ALG67281.1 Fe(2+) transporter permease subunit FeoB [Beggiatoa leptomitoformis]AUI67292.1 Fe(2+) transporter permease subunit FeoB [Beggiatoa leptomitoformis]
MAKWTVGVIGNPNCGKTTLFNALTGSKQRVGNWPGVTVERKTGYYRYADQNIELVDLPGIYSIDTTPGHTSLDEAVAQEYTLSGEADLIINIIDASNLERNLYLTTQLLEMHVPLLVVLNMMDMLAERGTTIDIAKLSEQLGTPVIPIVAAKTEGLEYLKQKINEHCARKELPLHKPSYPAVLEDALQTLIPHVKTILPAEHQPYHHWFSLKLLEDINIIQQPLPSSLHELVKQQQIIVKDNLDEDIDIIIADARYSFINTINDIAVKKNRQLHRSLSDKIDNIVLNRLLGIPIFLTVMYLMFLFTVNIGGAFIDFFDILFGTLFVEGFSHLLSYYGVSDWIVTLFANGIGGGVQVVATFIPVIAFLFLFLSMLEDSGYMARAAFVMDRFMRFIGLPGKSFVPMIVGFGCNVPAIMSARTLEHRRDRYLTILMNPFMSCGARLPVYALFAAAFFPVGGQNIVFGLYLIGILVAVLTGLLMKHTLFKGEAGYFVMELPAYHLPTAKNILLHTWERLKGFVVRAGKVIVPMVIVINFLNSWGIDGSFGKDNTDQSVLSTIGRTLTPAFEPMGIREDNWPAVVGIFTGVLAKEVVVGTLDAIYSQEAQGETIKEVKPFDLLAGIQSAFATIPDNLISVFSNLLDPLGFQAAESDSQETSSGTFAEMRQHFDGQIGAFAFLLFILMYFPCTAATATIYRETSAGYAVFVASWTTGVAYFSATLFYQIASYAAHPLQTLFWVGLLFSFLAFTIFILYLLGQKRGQPLVLANSEQTG